MAKNDYGYMARIGVDTSGLDEALRDSQRELKNAEDGIKRLDKVISDTEKNGGDSAELLAKREAAYSQYARIAAEHLTGLAEKQGEVEEAFKSGRITAGDYANYLSDLAIATQRVNSTQVELAQGQTDVAQTAAQAGEQTLQLGDIIKANVISDLTIKGIEKLTDAFKQLGEEIKNIAVGTAAYGDTVDKQSQRLGMTRDAYQEWNYILSQNGANISVLTAGMRKLTDQIDSAGSGGKAATAAFEKLGLSVDELQELTGEQQFSKVVTALQSMENETERNAVANDVLGRSYQQLIPLLNQDSDSVERLRQRAHDTNQILSDDGVNAAVNYTDAMDTLTRSIEGFKHQLGEEVLPILTEFIDDIIDVMNEADGEQMKEMIGKIAEGVRELADIIRDFISDGGIEKILDFFGWIVDHGEEAVNALKLLAGAWAVSKVMDFSKEIGKLPGIIDGLISSLKGAADSTSFATLSMNGWLAVAALAIAAAMELKTAIDRARDAMFEHSEAVNELDDKYNELNKTLEDFNKLKEESISLAAQEALANKENADKAVKQYEYQASSLEKLIEKNREYYGGELTDDTMLYYFDQSGNKMGEAGTYGDKMDELGSTYHNLYAARDIANAYDSAISEEASTGRQRDAAGLSRDNAGRTNEDALADVWNGIRKRTDEKMKELDDLLATHQITEEEYWAKRKEWLEAHRDEESKEWWEYYDKVTEYYDKAAKTEETASKKAADSAEKTAVNNVKRTMENLKRIQQEQGLSDEWLMEQYKLLADSLEKGTDAYYAAYDAYLDMRDKVRDENDRQDKEDQKQRKEQLKQEKKDTENELKQLQKDHDNEVKERKKEATENLKLLDDAKKDYDLKASKMSKRVTDKNGKERLVIGDYSAESKKLKKYRESMDKLKALGVSEELIASVNEFSYDDGSRQMYIDELLKMRPEKREQYDKEYRAYITEQKKTAEYDTELDYDDETKKLKESTEGVLDEASELAYQKGKTTGENYLKGINDALDQGELTGEYATDMIKKETSENKTKEEATALSDSKETDKKTDGSDGKMSEVVKKAIDRYAEEKKKIGGKAADTMASEKSEAEIRAATEKYLQKSKETEKALSGGSLKGTYTDKTTKAAVTAAEQNLAFLTASNAQASISTKTPITINVAGTSVIRMTLEELLRENILTGGTIRYV